MKHRQIVEDLRWIHINRDVLRRYDYAQQRIAESKIPVRVKPLETMFVRRAGIAATGHRVHNAELNVRGDAVFYDHIHFNRGDVPRYVGTCGNHIWIVKLVDMPVNCQSCIAHLKQRNSDS